MIIDAQIADAAVADNSFIDRPFGCPLDVVLDLPRKIDWRATPRRRRWIDRADALVLAARCRSRDPLPRQKIMGQFELVLTIDENLCKLDLDNSTKHVIDYLKRIELIVDDSQKYMRRVVIEFGRAPEGCRVTIKPLEGA